MIKISFGAAKTARDSEGGRPYLLVTPNINKLTPSQTVCDTVHIGNPDDGGDGEAFNIGYSTEEDGTPVALIYQEEGGYTVGKNGQLSAPKIVASLINHFGFTREQFEVPGAGQVRSFKLYFDTKPMYFNEEGESVESKENATFTAFKLGNATICAAKGGEDGEEAVVEVEETTTKKSKKK